MYTVGEVDSFLNGSGWGTLHGLTEGEPTVYSRLSGELRRQIQGGANSKTPLSPEAKALFEKLKVVRATTLWAASL